MGTATACKTKQAGNLLFVGVGRKAALRRSSEKFEG